MIRMVIVLLFSIVTVFSAQVGDLAPAFELMNQEGKAVKLSDFKGKVVILEWTNPECPFVKPHYESGAMQKLQLAAKDKGMIWLQMNSASPGKHGSLANAEAVKSLYESQKMKSTAYLLDPTGEVGRSYGAKTTPHLFMIDPQGVIIYAGAIDAHPQPDYDPKAQNYIKLAMKEILEGKKISISSTKPYGCSVKY